MGRVVKIIIESYFHGHIIEFDYSKIRTGEPISGFGGGTSGHEPLLEVHEDIRKVLEKIVEPINNNNNRRYYESHW